MPSTLGLEASPCSTPKDTRRKGHLPGNGTWFRPALHHLTAPLPFLWLPTLCSQLHPPMPRSTPEAMRLPPSCSRGREATSRSMDTSLPLARPSEPPQSPSRIHSLCTAVLASSILLPNTLPASVHHPHLRPPLVPATPHGPVPQPEIPRAATAKDPARKGADSTRAPSLPVLKPRTVQSQGSPLPGFARGLSPRRLDGRLLHVLTWASC